MLKITRDLIQPELCYIELDGLKVGTIYAFEGWRDRIREAIEEREATPGEIATLVKRLANAELLIEKLKEEVKELNFSVTLHDRAAEKARAIWEEAHPDAEFMPGRTELMVWLIERVEKAEAVKESLTSALLKISGFSAFWKCFRGNEDAWENVWNIATDALISLRTAEDSSVVESGNQPEVITKLGKALQNTTVVKRVLVENSCPSEFGLEDCEFNPKSGCTLCCEDCWNQEVEE